MPKKAALDSLLSNPSFADLEPEMVAERAARGEMRDFATDEEGHGKQDRANCEARERTPHPDTALNEAHVVPFAVVGHLSIH